MQKRCAMDEMLNIDAHWREMLFWMKCLFVQVYKHKDEKENSRGKLLKWMNSGMRDRNKRQITECCGIRTKEINRPVGFMNIWFLLACANVLTHCFLQFFHNFANKQIWPIVSLHTNCFFTLSCTFFNALGFIQLFVFIPLWVASWISPKVGSITLLAWCIFCTFATFFSAFGGWKTIAATLANLAVFVVGVIMAGVDVFETKRLYGDLDEDFESFEDLG